MVAVLNTRMTRGVVFDTRVVFNSRHSVNYIPVVPKLLENYFFIAKKFSLQAYFFRNEKNDLIGEYPYKNEGVIFDTNDVILHLLSFLCR